MILVDTNIIIDFWKNPSNEIADIFINNDVVLCGVVKAELLHGARDSKDFDKINDALSEFQYLETSDMVWGFLGGVLFRLKKGGLTLPFQDAILISLALIHDLTIWSDDKHFQLASKIIPELKIF